MKKVTMRAPFFLLVITIGIAGLVATAGPPDDRLSTLFAQSAPPTPTPNSPLPTPPPPERPSPVPDLPLPTCVPVPPMSSVTPAPPSADPPSPAGEPVVVETPTVILMPETGGTQSTTLLQGAGHQGRRVR